MPSAGIAVREKRTQTTGSGAAGIESTAKIIDLNRISQAYLQTDPYRWAEVSRLFAAHDAAALAATFPSDNFKRVADHAGPKKHEYQVRSLIRMSAKSVSKERQLSSAWQALAHDFLSPGYRMAMSRLIGADLSAAEFEANIFHYPPGGLQEAHTDHPDKIVTHVLYFNETWNDDDGGCLTILRSSNPRDIVTKISPLVGNSAVLVRSNDSWHAVSDVARTCQTSRRSLTATFYHPGRVSTTVWPSWDRKLRSFCTSRWRRLRSGSNGNGQAGM